MNKKERRIEIRIPILSEPCSYTCKESLDSIEGTLADMSSKGVYINSSFQPNVKDIIQVNFRLPSDMGIFSVNGRVTRKRWAVTKKSKLQTGFAVEFIDNIPKVEEVIKSYVIYMRNKQIITVSRRIIEEFFGTAEDKGPSNE